MPRLALSEVDVERQRQRALDAALVLFDQNGVPGVSLRAIAAEIGLTAMALYRYFPGGKNEVLATLRGRGFDDLAERFERAGEATTDPIDRFVALARILVAFALDNAALYRLMFDLTQPEEQEVYLATRRARAWKIPAGALHQAIDQGLLQAKRELFPHLVFAAVHGVLCFELSGQPSPERRVSRLIGPMLATLFRGASARPAVLKKIEKAF
jgi:AcrR family transcriptional regulator